MKELGQKLGAVLRGGEVIELVGDVGAGKTTLTKGIAIGLGVDEDVQSPSFTLSRNYDARDDLQLHHYDFYRLNDPGVVAHELAESAAHNTVVTIIEWAETVDFVLPADRLVISLSYLPDSDSREVTVDVPAGYEHIIGALS